MGREIYDDDHVAISRLLDRRFNNPLGEATFPLLHRLLGGVHGLSVLDVGCGRGASALWWAGTARARVTALDPSPAMLAEARRQAADAGLDGAITFLPADLSRFIPAAPFDLVLLHDVLCYVADKHDQLARAIATLRPGGIASITDYHGRTQDPEVDALVSAWSIAPPQPLADFAPLLEHLGIRLLLQVDTTMQYREHWSDVRARLATRRHDIVAAVGSAPVVRFAEQIAAIERAVATGCFGHLWIVVEKAGAESGPPSGRL